MVNFKEKRLSKGKDSKTNPLEIYEFLDRKSDKGPLRAVQKEVLIKWFDEYKDKRDIILKLHTGQGKTIIGLLILQSRLNQGKSPALYLCPNKFLVNQTCAQAESFGIKYCFIGEDKQIPLDFIDGKSILITTVQKLFNGKTKFGLNNKSIEVNSIVLDDAHSCISAIKDAFRIKIESDHELYSKLLNIFEDALSKQQAGTFADIVAGDHDSILSVPYWNWIDRNDNVLSIISEYKDDESVTFSWNLIKNILKECNCIFSGKGLEIFPYNIPLEIFGSYHNAEHRVFMSATLNDDSFFITGLGLSIETIKDTLNIPGEKWSGEKLILIPSLISDTLNRTELVSIFGKKKIDAKYGTVIIVPNTYECLDWEATGALIPKNFIDDVNMFRNGSFDRPLVLINRYDGVDLPDESCRILIMCSLPFGGTLEEKYLLNCRASSEQILLKTAQQIEQGIGRGVRGEKDYCCIIIIGSPLINMIKNKKTQKYFANQTVKQIDIGVEVSSYIENDIKQGETPIKALMKVIKQQIDRDEDWKGFYSDEMNKIGISNKKNNVLTALSTEREAYTQYKSGEIPKAIAILQKLIDKNLFSTDDKGWYLQEMGRYMYQFSIEKSNHYQQTAYKSNYNLFKPSNGLLPKKITQQHVLRNENIISYFKEFDNYSELLLEVTAVFDELYFQNNNDKFEKAMESLGKILGFESIRPDKENNDGPDNFWKIDDQNYILFECKSFADPNRTTINKKESGQMDKHINWFHINYSGKSKNVMVYAKASALDKGANFSDKVVVMRKHELELLKKNILGFMKEFIADNFNSLSMQNITDRLKVHKLSNEDILSLYYHDIKLI